MFTEDLDQFYDSTELGDLCVVGGVDVVGVFTAEGEIAEDVEGTAPILSVPSAAVPAVAHGTAVEAPKGSGSSFQVTQILPDSTGATVRLVLEDVA